MSTATKDHPSGSLRVSDADRDRAIAELSEHYQAGRLTTEELEDRTGRALAARTSADLAALFTDLPRRQAPVTSSAGGETDYIQADLRDTGTILKEAARTLDFSRPVAVLLIAILHFIPDAEDPYAIAAA
jgi:hypothetical protein